MDGAAQAQARVARYLPRVAISWLAEDPACTVREVDGTLVFADVSGFTALSERLARQGRIGAEILADTISACFTRLLAAAYSNGGSLLKFGGDALLLLFTGDDHCRRASHAVFGMRGELRSMGAIEGAGGRVRLGMSVGVHTGPVQLFLVGGAHRELIVAGPTASEVVRMEAAADKGEILVSQAVAEQLSPECLGAAKADGRLLRREPRGLRTTSTDLTARPGVDVMLPGLPVWLRELALAGSDDPQHRNVVVAFVKFSGVDGLIAGEGPSAVAAELDALVRDAQAAADQHGVFLLGSDVDKDGGKLILTAGAPTTSGDDEIRLLLALKQIVATKRLLAVRAGVNVGPTFAGDIGPAYRRTYTVMGDTVNLAARVMARADVGTVLATDAVLDKCVGKFGTTPVAAFSVKGKTMPVSAAVVDELNVADAPAASVAGRTEREATPLVGRDDELTEVLRVWARAAEGAGDVVIVSGEPGIGKSRLLAEAARRSAGRVVSAVAEPYATSTPYSTARQLVRHALGLPASGVPAERVRARLTAVLDDRAPGLRRWAPLIGSVIGVELPMTDAVAELDERFVRERLEEVVGDLLAVVLDEPTFLSVDDAQYADEASASLLDALAARIATRPWLLCAARRVDGAGFGASAVEGANQLLLGPLHDNAAAALVDALAGLGRLDRAVQAAIVARAGGNPLFVGELVAAASGTGKLDELPDSLEGVILTRIDGLAPADRSLLRRLSVFGGTFSHQLAAEVLGASFPAPDDDVWRRLADFVDVGSFRRMSFRNAVLMDGAYNSLPFKVRESMHATVAETMERRAGAAANSRADALSLHFYKARRYDRAWHYSLRAADKAKAVYANAEVATFLERAVDCARRGSSVPRVELFELHETLGDTYRRMGRLDEAEAAYRQARKLAEDDPENASRLMVKRAGVRQQAGAFPQAMRWLAAAEACLNELPAEYVVAERARVAVARASVAKEQSRGAAIVKWCEKALELAAATRDVEVLAHASFLLDLGYIIQGRPERAVNSARALAWYEELGNLWGQGAVLNNWGGHAYWDGRWDEAVDLYLRGRDAFERIGDVCNAALGLDNVGEIRSDQGRYDEAAQLFAEAVEVRRRVDDKAKTAYAMSNWGRLLTRRGDTDQGLETLTAAKAMSAAVGQAWDVTEASLRIVECLVHGGRLDRARDAAALLLTRPAGLVASQSAMLHRLVAYTCLLDGDLPGARAAVDESLGFARRGRASYELALSLRARGHIEQALGADPLDSFTEAQEILDGLGVVQVAEPPAVAIAYPGDRIPAQPDRATGATPTHAAPTQVAPTQPQADNPLPT